MVLVILTQQLAISWDSHCCHFNQTRAGKPGANDTMGRLNTWDIDFDTLLRSIPAEERYRRPPNPDSSYRGPRVPYQ